MKKILISIAAAMIAVFTFASCTQAENAASEAGQLVTDAVDTVASAASEMMNNTDGDVKDDNGSIGDNSDNGDDNDDDNNDADSNNASDNDDARD